MVSFLSKAWTEVTCSVLHRHPQPCSSCLSSLTMSGSFELAAWKFIRFLYSSIVLKRQNTLFKYERLYIYLQASTMASCTGCMYILPQACAVGCLSGHGFCILQSMGHSGPLWEERLAAVWITEMFQIGGISQIPNVCLFVSGQRVVPPRKEE